MRYAGVNTILLYLEHGRVFQIGRRDCVGLPVGQIDFVETAENELELLVVKGCEQLGGQDVVDAFDERQQLRFNAAKEQVSDLPMRSHSYTQGQSTYHERNVLVLIGVRHGHVLPILDQVDFEHAVAKALRHRERQRQVVHVIVLHNVLQATSHKMRAL